MVCHCSGLVKLYTVWQWHHGSYLCYGATEADGDGEYTAGRYKPGRHRAVERVLTAVLEVYNHRAESVQTYTRVIDHEHRVVEELGLGLHAVCSRRGREQGHPAEKPGQQRPRVWIIQKVQLQHKK